MLVKIQRNQIHHFKEPIFDADGNPIGEKDVLQFGIRFPEYPDLPTYGIRIDFPINKPKVLDAIRTKAQQVLAQMQADEAIRQHLGAEILEFNIAV